MVSFNKFFTSVVLAIAYANSAAAAPFDTSAKHAAFRTRSLANDVKLEVFNPPSTFEVRRQLAVTKIWILNCLSDLWRGN